MTDKIIDDIPTVLFRQLAIENASFNHTHYLNQFDSLKTDLERVNFVYRDMQKCDIFPEFEQDCKSDKEAIKFRELGNKKFQTGDYKSALEEYTRSIAYAKTEKTLALAFAKRSACLYKLELFENCVTDIERALSNNCPEELELNLVARKEQAEKNDRKREPYYEKVPKISEKNPTIASAANCVQIEQNEQFGRYIVATRKIQIGEPILVEKPFTAVVTNDRLIHCHECLELCYNLIPCDNCTQAMFCSEDCKREAQKTHEFECPILLSLTKLGMINSLLISLKVAILAKTDYDKCTKFKFNRNQLYCSDRYKEVHCLYKPSSKLSRQNLFYRVIIVCVLVNLLANQTNFFKNQAEKENFKEIMLHQVAVCLANGVNIFEYAPNSDGYERTHFAGGIYPFFSLFNHSCVPNLEGSFHGSSLVLRAINTIKKGEQCFINYDVHYGTVPKLERQMILKENFFFECKCKPCQEDWEAYLVDFTVNHLDIFDIEKKLSEADVEFAKKILRHLRKQLKVCEHNEPIGKALTLKKMISCCSITLGNKRRI